MKDLPPEPPRSGGVVNAHALSVLEFHRTLQAVANRAGSLPGRERLQALQPASDPEAVRAELARVEETLRFLDSRPDWAPPRFPDFRPSLSALSVSGAVLDPEGLYEALVLLGACRSLSAGLKPSVPDGASHPQETSPSLDSLPRLARLRSRIPVREDLEGRLGRIVDDEGCVRDGASPALRSIRRELRETRRQIVRRLEAFLAGLPEKVRVEGASVSIREGRYVVPVRREGKSDVGGIIHGESATGATLFIEPPLAIQLRNDLHELERQEAREVRRILGEATAWLFEIRDDLASGFEAQVDFDTLWARARTARAWRGTPPVMLDPGEEVLRVVDARHPLLIEQDIDVVPFSLELLSGERAVVVSGPNTGGKTVFLKTMGLVHLLAQSGVVPPVGPGTELPVLTDVFADIGDEQSLEASLSTFSAHLANLREVLRGAGPRCLVLVDEMGTGTDPAEGAAIARALLEVVVERGARAFVTSHLGALKRLDAEGSGIVNASLLFDAQRIEPTYQLQKGRPGRSYGIAIARRLGLPEEVLERAERYVDAGELKVESLLESLERKEAELAEALKEAEAARGEALAVRAEVERRESSVEARERTSEARAREEARRLLLAARAEVEDVIRAVRSAQGEGTADVETEARRRIEAAASELLMDEAGAHSGSRMVGASPVSEGDRVELRGSSARGVVRDLSRERVTVEVGGIRLSLPRQSVERLAEPSGARPRNPASPAVPPWDAAVPDPKPEVDLRGLRSDEVGLPLGRAIDQAVVGGLTQLRIIHGKGTGAVKAKVKEFLRADGRVSRFRAGEPGEGGEGVTLAVLGPASAEGDETAESGRDSG